MAGGDGDLGRVKATDPERLDAYVNQALPVQPIAAIRKDLEVDLLNPA